MEDHPSSDLVKMLIFGISGSGKTGLIGKLAEAGYRIFGMDFDDGFDILMDPMVMRPDVRKNVYYKTLKDNALAVGGKLIPQATAWAEFVSLLGDWKESVAGGPPVSLGNFRTWGPKDVLWIDSCTFLSDAAMNRALQLGGRLGARPQIQDYGAAMDDISSVFELLYSPHCKCNVVVTSHLQFAADENFGGARKAMVSVLGNKLAPKIPRYFNNMILLKKSIDNGKVVRKLYTQGDATVDLKTSKPSVVPSVMEPDLAKLFSLLTGP
jgi:hypothetical protein